MTAILGMGTWKVEAVDIVLIYDMWVPNLNMLFCFLTCNVQRQESTNQLLRDQGLKDGERADIAEIKKRR